MQRHLWTWRVCGGVLTTALMLGTVSAKDRENPFQKQLQQLQQQAQQKQNSTPKVESAPRVNTGDLRQKLQQFQQAQQPQVKSQPAPQFNLPKQTANPPANNAEKFQQQLQQFQQQQQQNQGRIKNPQPTIPGLAPPLGQNPTGIPNNIPPNLPKNSLPGSDPNRDRLQQEINKFREQLGQSKTGQPGQPLNGGQPNVGGRVKNPGEGQPFNPGQSDTLKPVLPGQNAGGNPLIPGQAGGLKPTLPSGPQLGNGQLPDLKNKLESLKPKDGQPNIGDTNPGGRVKNPALNPLNPNVPKTDEQKIRDALNGRVKNPALGGNPNVVDTLPGKPLLPKVELPAGVKPTTPIKIDRDGIFEAIKKHQQEHTGRPVLPGQPNKPDGNNVPNILAQFQPHQNKGPRNQDEVRDLFTKLKHDPGLQQNPQLSQVKWDRLAGNFQTQVRNADLHRFADDRFRRDLQIDRQFGLYDRGDIARQLNLTVALSNRGGWSHRSVGPIYANYTRNHFSSWYAGPSWYPRYCWTPIWRPWVSWSFWNWCQPIYDPRPFICRPVIYQPCQPIVVYDYPTWNNLPVVTCGTWVDVPPVVINEGFDLELLAVRFVDAGHPEQNLGPRYRVWVRNNSPIALGGAFQVTLVAANGPQLLGEWPQAGVTIPSMDAQMVLPVDIRLPAVANKLGRQADGQLVPFTHLHAIVDSHRDVAESNEANNGAILERGTIFPVDPAAFSTDVTAASPGDVVNLAGEGFGPEPGQLLVTINGVSHQAEIQGWYDLGVSFKVPLVPVNSQVDAQIIVVRGDGAVSNPVEFDIAPQGWLQAAPEPALPLAPPPAP